MGDNYHNPYAAAVTQFTAASMNPALASLDGAITYATKAPIIHSDGDITWAAGTLTWASTMRIIFNSAAGLAIQNTIATGSIGLSDNEFCYCDLSETNDAVVTVSKAAITTGAASGFIGIGRLVLAYRNTLSDEAYAVWLPVKYSSAAAGHTRQHEMDGVSDHIGFSGATVDEIITIATTTLLPKKSGRIITDFLDGRQYDCSTAGTGCDISWLNGGTQYMTLATATTTIRFADGSAGKVYRLLVKQSAAGANSISWGSTIKWRGASAATPSAVANSIDIGTFVYINSVWYGDLAKNFG
jgi:hypothetical protein